MSSDTRSISLNDSFIEVETTKVEDISLEKQNAREFWTQPKVQPSFYKRTPLHIEMLYASCVKSNVKRVLEFGCNAGRNLDALRSLYRASGQAEPHFQGIDINETAVNDGREKLNLDLILGGEEVLSEIPDNSFDLIFTLSVLDHVPEPESILAELNRICRGDLIFIEPHTLLGYGSVSEVNNSLNEADRNPVMPFTYIHNYDQLMFNLPYVELLNLPTPTHLNRLGPAYRYRWFRKQQSTTRSHILANNYLKQKLLVILNPSDLQNAVACQSKNETILAPSYFVHGEDSSSIAVSKPPTATIDGFINLYSSNEEIISLAENETDLEKLSFSTFASIFKISTLRQLMLEREIIDLNKIIKNSNHENKK